MIIRSITAPNAGPYTLDGTRSYVLGESAVIDPGPDISSHIEAILTIAQTLELILITHRHPDHAPAALPLKEATGARIVAPPGVLDDSSVDRRITGGEILHVEDTTLEVLPTPGHTAEHVCFLSAEGDLFTGDTVLGSGSTVILPPDGHMGDYIRSLKLLRSRNPLRIHPAHGPTREDAVALLDRYLQHRLERECQVLAAVRAGARTISAMREVVYPLLDPALREAAEAQLLAHVIKLQEEGLVPLGEIR